MPSSLWGTLKPVDTTPMSFLRDNTDFNEFALPGNPADRYGSAEPVWLSLDIDNGYLYTAISHGMQIWDLHTTPEAPAFIKTVDGPATWRQWPSGERKQVLSDIAVQGDLAALVGQPSVGIAIFDNADKFHPRLAYQDGDKNATQVYAATIGGRAYAFIDGHSTVTGELTGLLAYDMTRARDYSGCLDNGGACPGVMVRQISTDSSFTYVDGADNFVVASRGTARGVSIWNVADVVNPVLKLSALTGESVYGIALWHDLSSGKYYLATRHDAEARIYDVSCISTTSGCAGLGAPVWSKTMFAGTPQFYVTFSRTPTASYLMFGSDQICGGGTVREAVYDVTTPTAPVDMTPSQIVTIAGIPTSYWTWYYRDSPSGFNRTGGRMGKFVGDLYYRAAYSIFDIHKRTTLTVPNADFIVPSPIYAGVPATFNDSSAGSVASRTWNFQDGAVVGGTIASAAPAGSTARKDVSAGAATGVSANRDSPGRRVLLGAFGKEPVTFVNPGTQPLSLVVRFLSAGPDAALARGSERIQLGPNERRSVPGDRWGSGPGALVIESGEAGGRLPKIESAISVLSEREAAKGGEVWNLTGLRATRDLKTTILLFNPTDQSASVDLVYRAADGSVLGALRDLDVAPGLRAVRAASHPIGTADAFSVEVEVRSGTVLANARVAGPRP
ncbi:MAG: hypothetical protein ABJC13_04920 [Acidobacteriota bacterium]